jgi:hypothetical protein
MPRRGASDLAREAQLADRRDLVRDRELAQGARDRQCDGEVGRGFGEAHAPDRRDIHIEGAQLEPRAPLEDGEDHRDAGGIDAVDDPSRVGGRARIDQGLNLDGQGATTLECDRHARAADRGAVPEEQTARVGNLGDAVAGHLEASDLVRRSEPILESAHESQGGLAVTLEVADDIDEVLEQAWARDRAVFRDVPDDQHRQVALFGDADERCRDLADLARMPRETFAERG